MTNWTKSAISPHITILSALKVLDQVAIQFLIVVDESGRLLGTVTDGDIRRGILRGVGMDAPVTTVMNPNPTTATINEKKETIFALMRIRKLRHIPILDWNRRVVRVETLDSLLNVEQQDNPVILMAGGLGTRLRPLTDECPKPLLKVGGQPLLETIIQNFAKYGFYNIHLSVNYRSEMIQEYFGDGQAWGVQIRYVHETKRMGTAGSLTLLPDKPDKPLIIMNADLLTKVNFKQLLDFHTEHGALATMCVREYEYQIPYGVINVEEQRIISIVEKPVQRYFVNAGIYVLNPEALDLIPKETFFDMTTLYDLLVKNKQETTVFPIREYWMDIGRMDDFTRANMEFTEVFG